MQEHRARAPPQAPTARPTPISRTKSTSDPDRRPGRWSRDSTMPIISAMPTGSLKPDSPSRIGAGPALDLLAGEHRERDGGIGRREGSAEQPGERPVEPEQPVGGDGDERRRPERAEDTEHRDRRRGRAKPPGADAHAPLEEDHDQRQRGDLLDVLERQHVREPRREIGGDGCDDQQQRRRREADARGGDADDDRDREPGRDDQDDLAEVEQVLHAADSCVPGGRPSLTHCCPSGLTLSLRASHPAHMPIADTAAGCDTRP